MNENQNVQNVNGAQQPNNAQPVQGAPQQNPNPNMYQGYQNVNPNQNPNPNPNPNMYQGYPQQNPNPNMYYQAPKKPGIDFGKELGETFTDTIEVFKAPATNAPKVVTKQSLVASLTLTIIYAVLRIIFGMINVAIVHSNSSSGFYSYYTTAEKAIHFLMRFFIELLIAAATVAIIASLVMACASLFSKTKVSFVKSLSIASLFLMPVIPMTVLDFLFGLASADFGNLFMLIGSILGYFLVAYGLKAELKDDNKLPYAITAIFFCVSLAQWLLYLINGLVY
ncbi:MAG: hypothetical protein LUC25_02530 [Ruminococcus sp.]|nr:hypothetical protein [Ruminococcus sp.]